MRDNKARGYIHLIMVVFLVIIASMSCKKVTVADDQKIKPPVRIYIVTARIDKKGTNTNSEGTAVLKGDYDEATKILNYTLEYKDLMPELITLRSGAKGSVGVLIKELYKNNGTVIKQPLAGQVTLSPLQERNLLKGLWFVAVSTLVKTPEISGYLTLKQK